MLRARVSRKRASLLMDSTRSIDQLGLHGVEKRNVASAAKLSQATFNPLNSHSLPGFMGDPAPCADQANPWGYINFTRPLAPINPKAKVAYSSELSLRLYLPEVPASTFETLEPRLPFVL